MSKKVLAIGALTLGLVTTGAAGIVELTTNNNVTSASANTAAFNTQPQSLATHRCHATRSGNHWNCITPGSFCSQAAHSKYGYAYKTGHRYRCVQYANGRWRWKRA